MAISVSSYEVIFPETHKIVIVNTQPGEPVRHRLIINPTPDQVAKIQDTEDMESMLLDDGEAAYEINFMELKMNNGSMAGTPIYVDGSDFLDQETCEMITSYIMKYEARRAEETNPEYLVKSIEEEEEVVCVICQQEFQTGETYVSLECKHGYHKECVLKWLQKKNDCPICRADVLFSSMICEFTITVS